MSVERARSLRKAMTDAKERLWWRLRGRQLDGFEFRRQHPSGKYVLDFYCDDARLAVDLDGSQHGEPARVAHDAERTKWLEREGIRVVRISNYDALTNTEGVLEFPRSILAERPSPQLGRIAAIRPTPAEAGEGPCSPP